MRGDKQCRYNQRFFDAVFDRVVSSMRRFHPRAEIVRNFSAAAATLVPVRSLSFVYIDARHDYEGVLQDLHAWWPRVHPGGWLMGHDWTFGKDQRPVADALRIFLLGLSGAGPGASAPSALLPSTSSSPREVFVTSESPASWLVNVAGVASPFRAMSHWAIDTPPDPLT